MYLVRRKEGKGVQMRKWVSNIKEESEKGGRNEEGARACSTQVRSGDRVSSLFWSLRRSTLSLNGMLSLHSKEREEKERFLWTKKQGGIEISR